MPQRLTHLDWTWSEHIVSTPPKTACTETRSPRAAGEPSIVVLSAGREVTTGVERSVRCNHPSVFSQRNLLLDHWSLADSGAFNGSCDTLNAMSLGTVTLTLRPLRFAFLVDPFDQAGILQAIELNTLLWGGPFNPIVPVFRRSPRARHDDFDRSSARDVSEGLIQAFDPDYVVLVGKYYQLTVDVGHRTVINAADIL